jgi:hypothetical protein
MQSVQAQQSVRGQPAACSSFKPCVLRRAHGQRCSLRVAAVAMASPATASPLRTFTYNQLDASQLKQVLARPRVDFSSILATVSRRHRCGTTTHSSTDQTCLSDEWGCQLRIWRLHGPS